MNFYKSYFKAGTFLLLLCLCLCISAQTPSKKMLDAIDKISGTDFILQFDSLANVMEKLALQSKNRCAKLKPEEAEAIRTAYNTSVQKFNNILLEMKSDLLNPQKVKAMQLDPQVYSESYQRKFESALSYYQNSYLKTQSTVEGIEILSPVAVVSAIIAIIHGGYEIFKMVQSIRAEIREFNEDFLLKYFINPHKIKTWEEL